MNSEVFTLCMDDIFISSNSFHQIMHDFLFYQIYYLISLSLWNTLLNQSHYANAHYANDYSFDSWWNSV